MEKQQPQPQQLPLDHLQKLNAHKRDMNTSLDEATHTYNINGETDYTSMTTVIHSLFSKFDEEKIINNMMASNNWPNSKYYGLSKQEIKDLWEKNKNEASSAGTKMHYDIECFYNNISQTPTNTSIEFQYFMNFYNDFKTNLEPYRTEWIVYDEDLKIAGSIDMIFKKRQTNQKDQKDQEEILEIYDWKRCKEIVKSTNFNKWALPECINHFPDTNYWHYALQLNGYKYILTHKYNKRVGDLYLVCLHPNNKNNNYLRIKVPDLQTEIHTLFEQRNKTRK